MRLGGSYTAGRTSCGSAGSHFGREGSETAGQDVQKVNLQSKRLSLQMLHPWFNPYSSKSELYRDEVPQPTLSSSPRGRATRALHHCRFCRFSLSPLSRAESLGSERPLRLFGGITNPIPFRERALGWQMPTPRKGGRTAEGEGDQRAMQWSEKTGHSSSRSTKSGAQRIPDTDTLLIRHPHIRSILWQQTPSLQIVNVYSVSE